AEQLAREAVRIAEQAYTRPHGNRAAAHCQLAAVLHWRGRYAEAAPHFATANAIARELGRSDLHVLHCFMFAGYVHAANGDHDAALRDLERSWEILGEHGHQATAMGLTSCGTRASVLVRSGDVDAAAGALAGCTAEAGADTPLMYGQALAELDYARGDQASAAARLAQLRESRPPEDEDRYWMRPWMLSLLLAQANGDADGRGQLVAALGEFAQHEPLSHCVADPREATCLVLP